MNIWCMVLFAFVSLNAWAEMIDGPANIRDKPNGRTLFSLNDNVIVESSSPQHGWFKIDLPVYVDEDKSFVDDEGMVLNDSVKLYDENGSQIGNTLSKVKAFPYYDQSVVNGRRVVVLKGVTSKKNIRPKSILELRLAAVLDTSKTLSLDKFHDVMTEFHFKEWMPHEKFTPYILFDDVTISPSPWPRAVLFFYDKKFVAVYHSKPISSSHLILSEDIRGSTMSYVQNVKLEIRDKLSEIYYPIINTAN
jgi:hypothetical protein